MKFIKNKNTISENLSEKTFILNSDTGVYIELNESASYLWSSFKDKSSTDELINYLIQEYEIEKNIAQNDVNAFLEQCFSSKLLIERDI